MKRQSFNDSGHAHFLTFSCYRRRQLLTDDAVRLFFVQNLDAARIKDGFKIWAYVMMPEHVHLLIHSSQGYNIPEILRHIKEPFTKQVVTHWRKTDPARLRQLRVRFGQRDIHRFWQPGGGFDRNLFDMEKVRRTIEYIEFNPVRRGLAREPMEWLWSSATARTGSADGPISIDEIQFEDSSAEERAYKP